MDPIIVAKLAQIRQQEFIEGAAVDWDVQQNWRVIPGLPQRILWRLGGLMVSIGERLMAGDPECDAPLTADMTVENC